MTALNIASHDSSTEAPREANDKICGSVAPPWRPVTGCWTRRY